MGYSNQSAPRVALSYTSNAVWEGPTADPPPRSGTSSQVSGATSRSGTNSPYVKGGISITPRISYKKVRAIVSYRFIPVRRYRWLKDKSGRPFRRYYVIYRKKNVWGYKMIRKVEMVRTITPDSVQLIPNRLSYTARTIGNNQGFSASMSGLSGSTVLTGTTDGVGVMPGSYCIPFPTNFGVDVNSYANVPPAAIAWVNSIRNGVISKLYVNAKSNYANVANMLATAGQTTDMVSGALQSGIAIARACKKLDLRAAWLRAKGLLGESHRMSKDMSRLWLTYVYGVAPLAGDIYTIANQVRKQSRSVVRFRAKMSSIIDGSSVSNPGGGAVNVMDSTKCAFKAQVALKGDLSIPELAKVSGGDTPLATVWEVIPYSFILDWLYPLGDYLSSQTAFNMGVLSYHESTLYERNTNIECNHEFKTSGFTSYNHKGGSNSASIKYVSFTRSVGSPPAMPRPSFNFGGVTHRRALNALALFLVRT